MSINQKVRLILGLVTGLTLVTHFAVPATATIYLEPAYAWSSSLVFLDPEINWGDLNGDGLLDLTISDIRSSTAYRIRIFINNPITGIPQSNTFESTMNLAVKSMAWGDVDGDGNLDLAVATPSGTSDVVFFNQGNGSLSNPPNIWQSNDHLGSTSVAWVDYDLDGDLDLAFGRDDPADSRNVIYQNQAGVLNASPAWLSTDSRITAAIAWGRINSDAYPDMVCANNGSANTIYLSTGSGPVSPTPIEISTGNYGSTSVAIGDVNGDGYMDIVFGNSGSNPDTLYLNSSSGFTGPIAPSWSFAKSYTTTAVTLADLDNDGDLDLICANTGAEVQVFEWNSDTMFGTAPVWTSSGVTDATALAVGDFNADGNLELAVARNGGQSVIYLNPKPIFNSSSPWQTTPHNNTLQVRTGDANNDGLLDLASIGAIEQTPDQGVVLYVNAIGQLPHNPNWNSNPALTFNFTSIDFGDLVGDGFPELIAGSDGNPLTFFNNVAGIPNANPSWVATESYATKAIKVADINLDGYLDVAMGNYTQPVTVFLMDLEHPGSFPSTASWQSEDIPNASGIALGDVDLDGYLDLAVSSLTQRNADLGFMLDDSLLVRAGATLLFHNDNGALQAQHAWASVDEDDSTAVAWGDVNQDGYLDLACAATGSVKIYFNHLGTLSPVAGWVYSAPDVEFSDVRFSDVDNDGDLDLFVGGYLAPTLLFINEHGVLSSQPDWQTPQDNLKTKSIDAADINDDGDPELILGNYDQPSFIFENTLAPTTLLPNNPTIVKVQYPGQYFTSQVTITFDLFDKESDRCDVTPLYSPIGGGKWYAATGASGQVTENLTTSPTGISHQFIWNADADHVNSETVQFKIVAHSQLRHYGLILYPDLSDATRTFRIRSSPHVILLEPADNSAGRQALTISYQVTEAIPRNFAVMSFHRVAGTADIDHTFSALLSPAQPGIFQAVIDALDLNDDGSYTTDDHLVHGAIYDTTISVTDAAGNNGTHVNRSFLFDLQSPTSQITQPQEGQAYNTRNLEITGTANDDSSGSGIDHVDVQVNGLNHEATGTSTWSYAWLTLGDGYFSVASSATDRAGNSEAFGSPVHFYIDIAPPTVTITDPTEAQCITADSYTIRGSAADANGPIGSGVTHVQIDVGSGWQDVSGTTDWTYVYDFQQNGGFSFSVRAIDRAGNEGISVSRAVFIDRDNPLATITSPTADQVVSGLPLQAAGAFSDVGSGVAKVQLSLDGQAWTDVANLDHVNAAWNQSFDNVTQGSHTLQARAVDNCNLTTAEENYASVTFSVDTEPPHIMVAGYYTTNIQTNESGTLTVVAYIDRSTDNDINDVQVLYQGTPTGLYLADDGLNGDLVAADGLFTLQLGGLECLPGMQFNIELVARDLAGNTSRVWPYLTSTGTGTHASAPGALRKFSKEDSDEAMMKIAAQIQAAHALQLPAPGTSPYILAAGYADSDVSEQSGGQLLIWVAAMDADFNCTGINQVEIYYNGSPTGVLLSPTSACFYTLTLSVPANVLPAGDYLLEYVASDVLGRTSDPWPYVVVHDVPINVAPVADKYNVRPNEMIQFTANPSGGVIPYSQFHWVFGDGGESSDQDPTHAFLNQGTYRPTVTIGDCAGHTTSAQVPSIITVTTCEGFNLSCSASPTHGPEGTEVQFHADAFCGNAPYAYHWDFGDGSTSSQKDPRKTYDTAGSYHACVTASDATQQTVGPCCADISIGFQQLTCSDSVDKDFGSPGDNFHFTAQASGGEPPYSFEWDFGDSTAGSGQTADHAYAAAGNFSVRLTVTDSRSVTCQPSAITISVADNYITNHEVVQSGSLLTSKVWLQNVKSGDSLVWKWTINGTASSDSITFSSVTAYVEDAFDLTSHGADPSNYSGQVELYYNNVRYPQWTKTLPP